MHLIKGDTFRVLNRDLPQLMMEEGRQIQTQRWQAQDLSDKKGSSMVELLHVALSMRMPTMDLEYYRRAVQPNLPWADDHFEERVCRAPINPGTQWAKWPWGNYAKDSLDWNNGTQFNHNYMERYWPKLAGVNKVPTKTREEWFEMQKRRAGDIPHKGIRHRYGDLDDLIELFCKEPDTRQGYFPIWFPEDTGTAHSGRKPCTLGYQFIIRNNKLDITYYIRSCDMNRHFRDDVYLTIRLGHYILERMKQYSPNYDGIRLGEFNMHITNLHMFIGDFTQQFKQMPKG